MDSHTYASHTVVWHLSQSDRGDDPITIIIPYRGTFEPIVDTETEGDELEDKGTDSEIPKAPIRGTDPTFTSSYASISRPVNEGYLAELGAQLKLHKGILHNDTHRLDALPPTLFEGYGRNFTEFFSRSRAVRDEIHS
ncbi:hypothetical protein Tco_1115401 [Tanacetum coccineum]